MTISILTTARYTGCPNCGKALSIAEVIERTAKIAIGRRARKRSARR
ncbi:hypothetical protein M2310_007344 [Rhizobium leguminosarum]|uniref:Uncharacterized protein n=1 Tax=Rhizobium esperanzae TaxID=1967781 RepID=A0A7W6XZN8_9HYPH|nr:hypothetical protein [Rhizobium esperanzae]MDH6206647.1 hypothetical protein [Rhizobium leguminosarum]